MTRFKKLLYECKSHSVFCPKYRYRIVKQDVAAYIRQQIYKLCQTKAGVEILELNIQPDHVHLILSCPVHPSIQFPICSAT